ncbi:MAG: NAD(P)/FAD-dependent oxidoreductase [Thermomicrobiaceae bacterium]
MSGRGTIGVIGGGISGLAAAYRLSKLGYETILWERNNYLGGQAAAFPVAGSALEYFYHHLFTSDTEIQALMSELGIAEELIWLDSSVGFFADGKIYPLQGATDLLKLDFIPLHDRIRIGLVTLYLQRRTDWREFEQVSAAEWLSKAVGQRAFDRVFGAQLRAKFGKRYDQVAMVWFWNKIHLRTQSRQSPLQKEKLGYIRGSWNTLIDRLGEAIGEQGGQVSVGVGTESLTRNEDQSWDIRTTEGETVRCDALVATVPSPLLLKLVPDLPDWYQHKLTAAIYQGAIVMILRMNQRLSDTYWLNIGDPSIPFTGIIEHTNFIGPENFQGNHFVYISKYLDQDHPYLTMDEDELFDEYVTYLQRINPDFSPDWVLERWVFRERAAQPIITQNYSNRVPEHRTPHHGLYLANSAQIYPEDRGTNYSIRLGEKVAKIVDNDFRHGYLGDASANTQP